MGGGHFCHADGANETVWITVSDSLWQGTSPCAVDQSPLLSSRRCNVTSSLLCARYPAAAHAAGQMASRGNLLSAVCGAFWMRDRGKEESSVKFRLHSAWVFFFQVWRRERRIITASQGLERTTFSQSAECWQVCGQTDLQVVGFFFFCLFVVPGATSWTHVDALLVMEIDCWAENPQGQVTSGYI